MDHDSLETMRFTCKLEPSDCRRAAWVDIKPRPVFAVVGIVMMIIALAVFTLGLHRLAKTGEGLVFVICLGASLAYMGLYVFAWQPRRFSRLYKQQKLLQGEFTFEITDEHLVSRDSHGETKLPWSVFHKWKSADDIVILYQSDTLFHAFPSRWFPSVEDFQHFKGILRSHLGEDRG